MYFATIIIATLASIVNAGYVTKPVYGQPTPVPVPGKGCGVNHDQECCPDPKWWDNECHKCEKAYYWDGNCHDNQKPPSYPVPTPPHNPDYAYCKKHGLLDLDLGLNLGSLLGLDLDLGLLRKCRLLDLDLDLSVGNAVRAKADVKVLDGNLIDAKVKAKALDGHLLDAKVDVKVL